MIQDILYNHNLIDEKNYDKVLELYKFVLKFNLESGNIHKTIEDSVLFFNQNNYFPILEKPLDYNFLKGIDVNKYIDIVFFEYKRKRVEQIKLLMLSEQDQAKIQEFTREINLLLSKSKKLVIETVGQFNFIEYYESMKNKPKGLLTNIKMVDDIIGGIGLGEVVTIGAPPSMGKTLMCVNMIHLNAKENYKCLFLSLEVFPNKMKYKFLSRFSYDGENRISFNDLNKNKVDSDVVGKLSTLYKDIGKNIVILGREDIVIRNAADIEYWLSLVKEKFDFDALFIDYIQLFKFMSSDKRYNNEFGILNEIVDTFRNLAVEWQFALVILSQVNRKGLQKMKDAEEKKKNKMYNFTDLSEISALEQVSDHIFFLYKGAEMENEVMMQQEKNRDGDRIPEMFSVFIDPAFSVMGDVSGVKINYNVEDIEDIFDNDF